MRISRRWWDVHKEPNLMTLAPQCNFPCLSGHAWASPGLNKTFQGTRGTGNWVAGSARLLPLPLTVLQRQPSTSPHHTLPQPGEPQALELASLPSEGKALLGFKPCPEHPGYHHRGWLQERFLAETSGRERNWVASMTTSLLFRETTILEVGTPDDSVIQHWLLELFHYILLSYTLLQTDPEGFSWALSSRISALTTSQLRWQAWS